MTNPFNTEAELCAAFLACVPATWQAYPESCGFDIVLAHKETGAQIGIEAKLTLNAKVLVQVTAGRERFSIGPDYRAVLVGKVVAENAVIAKRLGVRILTLVPRRDPKYMFTRLPPKGYPTSNWLVNGGGEWLPDFSEYRPGVDASWWSREDWEDEAPDRRLVLPEYVPQVAAGVPAPQKLSHWMIQAIKLCIAVERLGCVSRRHFEDLNLHPSRWCGDTRWLEKSETRGLWRAGRNFPGPGFKKSHPVSWAEIERDWPIWGAKLTPPAQQPSLNLAKEE